MSIKIKSKFPAVDIEKNMPRINNMIESLEAECSRQQRVYYSPCCPNSRHCSWVSGIVRCSHPATAATDAAHNAANYTHSTPLTTLPSSFLPSYCIPFFTSCFFLVIWVKNHHFGAKDLSMRLVFKA